MIPPRQLFFFLLFSFFTFLSAMANVSDSLDDIRNGNIESACKQLISQANTNNVVAQFYVAELYENGIGVEENHEKAFLMYRKAAERGFVPGMKELARCYREGIGIAINHQKAQEWEERYMKRFDGTDIIRIRDIIGNVDYAASPILAETSATPSHEKHENRQSKDSGLKIKENEKRTFQNNNSALNKTAIDVNISDVDRNIYTTKHRQENTFVLIIANENYQEVASVAHAINDGEIFKKYCENTLGIPAQNIHLIRNATLNNLKREFNLLSEIGSAYNGDASFIVYYAGHGMPDEKTRDALIIPVDGYMTDITTCYRLSDLYQLLGEISSKSNIVIMDACFSGATRDNAMLASARGIAIKPNIKRPKGKTIVLSSSQGDETSFSYNEQHHGLFTYYLLKRLQETRGESTLGDLFEYIKQNVLKKSLVVNGKSQTPSVSVSPDIESDWQTWKLGQ